MYAEVLCPVCREIQIFSKQERTAEDSLAFLRLRATWTGKIIMSYLLIWREWMSVYLKTADWKVVCRDWEDYRTFYHTLTWISYFRFYFYHSSRYLWFLIYAEKQWFVTLSGLSVSINAATNQTLSGFCLRTSDSRDISARSIIYYKT